MVIDFSYDFRSFEHKRVQRAHADKFKQPNRFYSVNLQIIKWLYITSLSFMAYDIFKSIFLFIKFKHKFIHLAYKYKTDNFSSS